MQRGIEKEIRVVSNIVARSAIDRYTGNRGEHSMLRYTIPFLLLAGLLWLFADGLSEHGATMPSSLIGKPAPQFSSPRLLNTSETFSSSDIAGQAVILNAWAFWCKACWSEHPLLMELSESQAIPIYGLNFRDRHEKALSMMEKVGNPYVASAFDNDGSMGMKFGVEGLPATFLIGGSPSTQSAWKAELKKNFA